MKTFLVQPIKLNYSYVKYLDVAAIFRSRVTSPSVATTAVTLPIITHPKKGVSVREKGMPKTRKSSPSRTRC